MLDSGFSAEQTMCEYDHFVHVLKSHSLSFKITRQHATITFQVKLPCVPHCVLHKVNIHQMVVVSDI